MRVVYVCEEREKELEREAAPGKCPCCGGKVQAVYVQAQGRFLGCVTVCFRIKKKFFCTLCSKRLVLTSQIHPL